MKNRGFFFNKKVVSNGDESSSSTYKVNISSDVQYKNIQSKVKLIRSNIENIELFFPLTGLEKVVSFRSICYRFGDYFLVSRKGWYKDKIEIFNVYPQKMSLLVRLEMGIFQSTVSHNENYTAQELVMLLEYVDKFIVQLSGLSLDLLKKADAAVLNKRAVELFYIAQRKLSDYPHDAQSALDNLNSGLELIACDSAKNMASGSIKQEDLSSTKNVVDFLRFKEKSSRS